MRLRQTIAAHAAHLREDMAIDENQVVGDLIRHIQEAGYYYMEESFGDEFSAFSRALENGSYLIGFNLDHFWSDKFRRFTLSHELGHVTIPEHRQKLQRDRLHQSKCEFQSRVPIEREADYFAISFLAPRIAFQTAMKWKEYTKETISQLSDYFKISQYSAALRFVELTDLSCTLVVCNADGFIDYELRSDRMKETYKQGFLNKGRVKGTTLTYDYINGRKEEDTCKISMGEWFDDLHFEIDATESVIELGYNGKFLTLLVPDVSDLTEYMDDEHY